MKGNTGTWYCKVMLLFVLLWILLLSQVPIHLTLSEGNAYKLTNSQLRYRGMRGEVNFSRTSNLINISGNLTMCIAQTWLPVDEYPPNTDVRTYLSRANNESEKRLWYWNSHFLNFVEDDIRAILASSYPDIILRQQENIRFPNVTSAITMDILNGDPMISTGFNPNTACILFNATFLPNMSVYFTEDPDPEDLQLLTRWENTSYELEGLIRSRWYVADFSFADSTLIYCPGCPTPPLHIPLFIIGIITVGTVFFSVFGRIKAQWKR